MSELEKKILDPNLGYKFSHEHHDLGSGNMMTKINVHAPTGEHVGAATFMHQGNSLVPGSVVVDEDHQRRGIASGMYAHAQKMTGKAIAPSSNQTPEGAALWSGNSKQPQFGAPAMKNDDLEKMAIADIKPGARLPGGQFSGEETYNYNHVLPPEHQKEYSLYVQKDPKSREWQAHLYHKQEGFRPMKVGDLDAQMLDPKRLKIGFSRVGRVDTRPNQDDSPHRGKGLGTAMYEALLAHAKHCLGATHVVGDEHSTLASGVHSKLAQKHGMEYRAEPNLERFKNPEAWQQARTGAFDNKFSPYEYAIKSERLRKREEHRVASVAVFNKEGKLLFGKRGDNGKWTLPGGHFEVGETPKQAAIRELQEESGFEAKDLEFLGSEDAGSKTIYSFKTIVDGQPDASADPDAEMADWEWVDTASGKLPEHIANNLHSPKNITLQFLGLQEKSLEKSLKHKIGALIAGATLATAAQAQQTKQDHTHAYNHPTTYKWRPTGLATDMYPIAHLESSWGKHLEHAANSKGAFHTAFGAVGFKPITAWEAFNKDKGLKTLFPKVKDEHTFLNEFKTNVNFYNTLATKQWNHLKKLADGDLTRTAYGWRWGQGAMVRNPIEVIQADPYAQAFGKIAEKLKANVAAPQVAKKSEFESIVGQWLAKDEKTGKPKPFHYSGGEVPAAPDFNHEQPTYPLPLPKGVKSAKRYNQDYSKLYGDAANQAPFDDFHHSQNQKHLLNIANHLIKTVGAPEPQGVTRISGEDPNEDYDPDDNFVADGNYDPNSGLIKIGRESARDMAYQWSDFGDGDFDEHAVQTLTHEIMHGASQDGGHHYYEDFKKHSRPHAALEESTTELLAHHYLPSTMSLLGGGADGYIPTEPSYEALDWHHDPDTQDLTLGTPTAYSTFVNQFGKMARAIENIQPKTYEGSVDKYYDLPQLNNAIWHWAHQVKRLRTGPDRYSLLFDELLKRRGFSPPPADASHHPFYSARNVLNKELKDKGFFERKTHSDEIEKALEKAKSVYDYQNKIMQNYGTPGSK